MDRAVKILLLCAVCGAAAQSVGMNIGLRMAMWNPPAQGLAEPRTFGECLNWPGQEFATGGDAEWFRAVGVSADGYALRSGAITHDQTSRLETVVSGSGTIAFRCKVSCEDYFVFRTQRILLDHLSFAVDGVERAIVNGETDWTNCTFVVEGAGEHVFAWSYIKDLEGSEGEDCAWLDEVTWTPDVVVDVGGDKSVAVPQTWIDEYPAIVAAAGGDKTAALNATAANGRLSVVECYVLGLDPENETNDFRIVSFPMGADGKPDVANIVFEPAERKWNVAGARAVLKGAEALDDDWHEVDKASEEDRAKYRFYKVVVELP